MITMTHKERQKAGRLLAVKLLDKRIPEDAPEWKQVRELLGASNESKPGPVKSSKAKGTRQKQHEAMVRRKKEYPKLIEEGYNNVQMEKILKISRSVVSHDLMRFGLQTHQRYHWRATNTVTKNTGYYTTASSMQADTKIVKALWRIDRQAVVGPWLIERGCWYQDSQGNWYEAPK
ncbi:hypothetical protein EFT87_12355 [Schleiferilactobacillus harbinensis]|uniref:hypothetical protein n=1 Tax=Schleiferilactobacillus harbinensis TaxID=304207 RepID=UPI0021A814C2|nr:hypothetical protein [Schleiferilactobacillus harbinensis]MCT2909443.1 hypothetical protein [Schleiferilactobacillus harbinensis]